jgi:hypothetical protein
MPPPTMAISKGLAGRDGIVSFELIKGRMKSRTLRSYVELTKYFEPAAFGELEEVAPFINILDPSTASELRAKHNKHA